MRKKLIVALILFAVLTGTVFSQQKYNSFDWLLGFGTGFGTAPDFITQSHLSGATSTGNNTSQKVNIAGIGDFGLNLDMYVFPWLSLSTGVFYKFGAYMQLDANKTYDNFLDLFEDYYLTTMINIPLMAHINVPFLDFLYIGAGIAVNFPLESYSLKGFFTFEPSDFVGDTDMFYSTPIDIGFDFVGDGGGGRLFIRVTPEYRKEGIYYPVGIFWQMYNFRIARGSTSSPARKDYSGYTEER